ncbi:hypothetical protein MKW98_030686 [Papaver atlanticum]|uniref:beta-ketoacyl-[acyl-carrier-protein] synthase I n=1 Tax=Papaver atlanticum TaxID=357466 RepID=A0AAD4X2N7_9MAGN|nr:hypothetical protein MKW98_030686 [Papaver atlanticum]
MGTAFVTSPLCTWLVAACMSNSLKGFISSFCGSLMSSCLAFEPCQQYYTSKGLTTFFGESLFGSSNTSNRITRKQGRIAASQVIILTCIRDFLYGWKTRAVAVQPSKDVSTESKPYKSKGHEPDEFYNNLLEGVSRISGIQGFDCSSFPTRIAGEIESFRRVDGLHQNSLKRADKFMLYMLAAGKKDLADGGVSEEVMNELDNTRCGVLTGSGMGGMKVFHTTNMGPATLAIDLGWISPNYSISTSCTTSNFCNLNAANHIIRGEADVVLRGGSDSVIIPLGGFVACRTLSNRTRIQPKLHTLGILIVMDLLWEKKLEFCCLKN